jgi:O-antigen/teichoic acid export membrane protein
MIQKKRVLINVFSSAFQVGLIGIIYFFLYRYLLKHLGVELLGVWSVVMATSSVANLANFGMSTSVVRFVALYVKSGDTAKINKLIFTAVIFVLALFVALSLLIVPFAQILLAKVVDAEHVAIALRILPYSIICLILNSVGGVYASVLDGMQKNYLRSLIYTFSSIVLLVATYLLTNRYGLQGVVFAQLAQSVFAILGCLLLVINLTSYNPFKWQWSKSIFKEIFAYGLKFQFISLAAMFNEPITKILMAKFGGLQFTGYYEMANRLIMQLRGVVINANQSLIPLMVKSDHQETETENSNEKIYKLSFLCVSLISIVLMFLPVYVSGIISGVWIGHYESIFDLILFITAVSMYINLLCGPAYFAMLSEGNLNSIMISQIVIALVNVMVGYGLGMVYGGMGVVSGWLIAVVLGTSYLIFQYARQSKIMVKTLVKSEVIYVLVGFSALFALKYLFPQRFINNLTGELILVTMALIIFSVNAYSLYTKNFKSNFSG